MVTPFDDEQLDEQRGHGDDAMRSMFDFGSDDVIENPHHDNPDTPSHFDDGTETIWNDKDNKQYPYYDVNTGIPDESERGDPVTIDRDGLVHTAERIATGRTKSDNSIEYRPEAVQFNDEMKMLKHCANLQDAYVCRLDPFFIKTNKDWFQFKQSDASGETGVLKTVREWRNDLSGMAFVWVHPDGTPYIVDGHQRLGLAQRLKAKALLDGDLERANNIYVTAKVWKHDSPDFQIPGKPGEYLPINDPLGPSQVEHMKIRAAMKNIAEKTGTVFDAANVLRALKDPRYEGSGLIPDSDMFTVKNELIRRADKLAQLVGEAYDNAVDLMSKKSGEEGEVAIDVDSEALDWIIRYAPHNESMQFQMINELREYLRKHGEISPTAARNLMYQTSKLLTQRGSEDIEQTLAQGIEGGLGSHGQYQIYMSAIDEKNLLQNRASNYYSRQNSAAKNAVLLTADPLLVKLNKQLASDTDAALRVLERETFRDLDGFFDHHAIELQNYMAQNYGPEQRLQQQYLDKFFFPELIDAVATWNSSGRDKIVEKYGEDSSVDSLLKSKLPFNMVDAKKREVARRVDNSGGSDFDKTIKLDREISRLQAELNQQYDRVLKASNNTFDDRAQKYNDIRLEIEAREELIDKYWIDDKPERRDERTPDARKTPDKLQSYIDNIAYSIGRNENWEESISAIYKMGEIEDEIKKSNQGYDGINDETINEYLKAADSLLDNLNSNDPQLISVLSDTLRSVNTYYAKRRQDTRIAIHNERLERELRPLLEKLNSDISDEEKIKPIQDAHKILDEIKEISGSPEYVEIQKAVRDIASTVRGYKGSRYDPDNQYNELENPELKDGDKKPIRETIRRPSRQQGYERGNRWAALEDGGNPNPENKGYRVKNLAIWYYDSDMARSITRAWEARKEYESLHNDLFDSNKEDDIEKLEDAKKWMEYAEDNIRERRIAAGLDPDFDYPNYDKALYDVAHKGNIAARTTTRLYHYVQSTGRPTYSSWHKEMENAYYELATDGFVLDNGDISEIGRITVPKEWEHEGTTGAVQDHVEKYQDETGSEIGKLSNSIAEYNRAISTYDRMADNRGLGTQSDPGERAEEVSVKPSGDISNDIRILYSVKGNTKQEINYTHPAIDLIEELKNIKDTKRAFQILNEIKIYINEARKWGKRKVLNPEGAKDPPGPRLIAAADLLSSISNSLYVNIKMESERPRDLLEQESDSEVIPPAVVTPVMEPELESESIQQQGAFDFETGTSSAAVSRDSINELMSYKGDNNIEQNSVHPAYELIDRLHNTSDKNDVEPILKELSSMADSIEELSTRDRFNRFSNASGPRMKKSAEIIRKIVEEAREKLVKKSETRQSNRRSSSRSTGSGNLRPSKPAGGFEMKMFRSPEEMNGHRKKNVNNPEPIMPKFSMGGSRNRNGPPKIIRDLIKHKSRKPRMA